MPLLLGKKKGSWIFSRNLPVHTDTGDVLSVQAKPSQPHAQRVKLGIDHR